jgi:hypothetical protein
VRVDDTVMGAAQGDAGAVVPMVGLELPGCRATAGRIHVLAAATGSREHGAAEAALLGAVTAR